MALNDKSLRDRLSKHSKTDIIDAICDEFHADYTVQRLLHFLESRAAERAIEQERKAFDAGMRAREDYLTWLQQMAQKYGDGKEFRFGDLPERELKKGAKLSECVRHASKYADAAMKRTRKTLGI